jgi:hypothetical protein
VKNISYTIRGTYNDPSVLIKEKTTVKIAETGKRVVLLPGFQKARDIKAS